MPANVKTMAYVDQKPWHGLGQRVDCKVHAAEMMRAAGLDWEVEKRPARGAQPVGKRTDGLNRYARYEVVRLPPPGTQDEEAVLGIVTDRYEPLQNQEAFQFFDSVVDQQTAFFETAGALGDGERVWVLAKMPETIAVVRGDECHKYLLLSNTHTGQGAVIVKFTAIRVVCQNTLMLAMEDGQKAFRVRHSKVMSRRLEEIGDLIVAANQVYAKAIEAFQQFAAIRLDNALFRRYVQDVYPKNPVQERDDKTPQNWEHVQRLFEEVPDLQLDGVRGTLWGAFNAITRFEDYRVVRGESAPRRLDRVWFGTGADVKLRAFRAAEQLPQTI